MAGSEIFSGRWALVTGASSGIGAAIARELASRGARLILTARRQQRLEALAAELRSRGTEARILLADLGDPAAPQRIFDATEGAGLTVDILVNNAGLGQYGVFHTSDPEQEFSEVRVNCEAVLRLTRLFVPRMVERRRGWVLVTASTASFQPFPYLATYAATKAFARFFALGIAEELAPFGVKVTALCPGTTESEFFEVAHASVFRSRRLQPAAEVARLGIDALVRGQRTCLPKRSGRLRAFIVRFLPVTTITRFLGKHASPAKLGL
jgi:uncharacterized protein